MSLTVAVSGDAIINRRVSTIDDERFLDLVEAFREADAAFTHLETLLHDFDGPAVYPAAEAGGTWMRSPPAVADELAWMGIDVVSHASNHALDYGYGGLRETWDALDGAGIPYAGTGTTLGDARAPAYLDAPNGRVALVSMTSSFAGWTRAGEARDDVPGRPGLNPLRYHHAVDAETMATLEDLARRLGWWVVDAGDGGRLFHPPGLHNTLHRFVESDDGEVSTVPDERDLAGNRRAIADAAEQADLVIGHLHAHAWDPDGDLADPAAFEKRVARECVEAGADLFVVQGTHSPMRGIELHEGCPIFYDPGDLFRMSDTVERLPAEFYRRFEGYLDGHPTDATPSEGFSARRGGDDASDTPYDRAINPPGGYFTGSVRGCLVPVCTFEDGSLSRIVLHPCAWPEDPPMSSFGVPVRASGEEAEGIVADVAAKSEAFGTDVRFEDGRGVVDVE